MIKGFKMLSRILLITAVVAFGAAVILPGATLEAGDRAFYALLVANVGMVLGVFVGVLLTASKNETACKVGHGLLIGGFTLGLLAALTSLERSVAAVVMLAAAAMFALHYVALLVAFILRKGRSEVLNPEEDVRIVRIREWKNIMDEGIISKEEYEEKRMALLGLKPKNTK